MSRLCTLSLAAAALALALPAAAQDDAATLPKPLEAEYCFGASGYIKQLRKFDTLDADRRDTVGPVLQVVFVMDEGEAATQRVELRQGETVVPVPLEANGPVLRSDNIADMLRARSKEVEGDGEDLRMCVVDPAREGRLWSDVGYEFQPSFGVRFHDTSGTHSLEALEKGGKDGRKHWKKMAGAMGFMVPKFDHVAVATNDESNPPVVIATRGGAVLGPVEGEFYDGARMVPLDTLEDMGADGIRVEADDYRMTPSPSAKTVRRFAGGGGADEAD